MWRKDLGQRTAPRLPLHYILSSNINGALRSSKDSYSLSPKHALPSNPVNPATQPKTNPSCDPVQAIALKHLAVAHERQLL